ncbi:MAG: lectin, partial [Gemmatimonadota bacterium]
MIHGEPRARPRARGAPALGQADDAPMTFFITSTGPGDGADLGGLDGADVHCRMLAEAVGAGDLEWRAYLSAVPADGEAAVHARDRIGAGPWHNQQGVQIARDVDHLHSDDANLTKETILTEAGAMVN